MDGWTIKGDADVTVTTVAGVTYGLDDTERTFAQMKFAGWQLKFAPLADDFFSYTVRTQNAKGKGAIVPRDGQSFSVFYDGVRKFKGTVVKPMLGLKQLKVTALGPWWWMGKITLSGATVDATGITDDRTSYVFPTQNLRLSLQSLINRAQDKGVPMKSIPDADLNDRISGMFAFLKTTLSNMSFAAALAELLGNVPDAVGWFDYEANPPALNIGRRDDLAAISYEVGSTGTVRVESAEIYPRTDQKVQRVELKYAKRVKTSNKPQWASQNHGTVSTDTHKRQVQIITVSGPETLDLVPKDDFEVTKVLTSALNLSVVANRASNLKEILVKFGSIQGLVTSSVSYYAEGSPFRPSVTVPFPPLTVVDNKTGQLIAAREVLVSPESLADWLSKDMEVTEVTVRGSWLTERNYGAGDPRSASFAAMYAAAPRRGNGYSASIGPTFFEWAMLPFECSLLMVNKAYRRRTKVYKPWDYDFLNPPDNLAENLRDCQNWTPWEGPVVIVRPSTNGNNHINRKFNLTNSHPDHDGMDALVRSVTYTSNRVSYELGSPARSDLGGLVNKMRRNPQDNIVWL